MPYNSSITFAGSTLEVESLNAERVPSTIKQIVGGDIFLKNIPGRNQQDWKITINGTFFSSTRDADRDSLQTLRNNNTKSDLIDGLHNGSYYILSLRWPSDQNPTGAEHRFTMEIIQDT